MASREVLQQAAKCCDPQFFEGGELGAPYPYQLVQFYFRIMGRQGSYFALF